MPRKFQLFKAVSQKVQTNLLYHLRSHKVFPFIVQIRDFQGSDSTIVDEARKVQNLLKVKANESVEEIELALNQCKLYLNEDLVLDVLSRHRYAWKPAYNFFNWVWKERNRNEYTPGPGVYNEIIDTLGKMKRFVEAHQVLDEMSNRNIVNDETYSIIVNRYAAAHMVEEAIEFYYKRRGFGLDLSLDAFQKLLLCLCRYKHVEAAEYLFHSKQREFDFTTDIKTRNIILNGWCNLGSLREAKRFWKDIIASECKPDRFTYSIFINSLTKSGKLSTAVKLFHTMWEKGCEPDVAICNCIIDALCFKKKIPQAFEIFDVMSGRNCLPNVATYNSLIKHLCKIQRMEKVYELLDQMEKTGGVCTPNSITFGFLLNSAKNPDEVPRIMERMQKNGARITPEIYNLLLRLFMGWGERESVNSIWVDMERDGVGPDRRSYTIMIHGLLAKKKIEKALCYYKEMISKGIEPEPRTNVLINATNTASI